MRNRLSIVNKIEVSERNNGDLDLNICLCDFETNANGKRLNIETVDNYINTLIDMPLQGRISQIAGTDEQDFTSHNRKVNYILKDGQLSTETILDTDSIGVFKDIKVEYVDGKPFIFASALMWGSRYKNAKEIILNRANSEQGLYGSWEFIITDSIQSIENGTTFDLINNGYFIGYALLGRNPNTGSVVNPAYQCSKILSVAEEENDDLISAIDKDIKCIQSELNSVEDNKSNNEKGGDGMENINKDITEPIVEPIVSEDEKKEQLEISALTINDIKRAVWDIEYDASKQEEYWLYDSIIYPLENTVYFSKRGNDCIEEDWLKVVYAISDDGKASIISKEDVKMVFIPKVDNVSALEISEKLEKIEVELSEKIESIVKLGETIKLKEEVISQKDLEISQLQVFKTQVEEIQAEQAKQEIAEKQKALKGLALSSKYISENDIETNDELKRAISELDEKSVKLFIAEQVIKSNKNNIEVEVSEDEDKEIEVSTDINADQEYLYDNVEGNALLSVLNKKKRR